MVTCLLARLLQTLSLLFAAGWWLVENTDKQIAWFPASYLEEIDVHKDIQNALSSNQEGKSASGSLGHHAPPSENEFCKNPTTSTIAWGPCLEL